MVCKPKFSLARLFALPSSSSSSSPPSYRMGTPPFSIAEFGNLVALALDDRFSESFLQLGPEIGCGHIKASPVAGGQAKMTSAWADSTRSRPRRLFEKLKHKASALVLRTVSPPPKAARAIFSRPASLVTAPPSPTKSARSYSTASSASPATPTTPSPCSRWSLSTDESSPEYPCHPFASTHDVTTDDGPVPDPFAKGRVQVIRNSTDYTYAFANPRPAKLLRIHVQPPAAPPPDWTLALPTTPPRHRARSSFSHDSNSSDDSYSRSLCPSAWNPSPPAMPRTRTRTRKSRAPPTADSTASTATSRHRERERARALAALNGEVHPRALEAFACKTHDDADAEQAYYSARSSYVASSQSPRASPPRPRVRVDSQVRPPGC